MTLYPAKWTTQSNFNDLNISVVKEPFEIIERFAGVLTCKIRWEELSDKLKTLLGGPTNTGGLILPCKYTPSYLTTGRAISVPEIVVLGVRLINYDYTEEGTVPISVQDPSGDKKYNPEWAFVDIEVGKPSWKSVYSLQSEDDPADISNFIATEMFLPSAEFVPIPRSDLVWLNDGLSFEREVANDEHPTKVVPLQTWLWKIHYVPASVWDVYGYQLLIKQIGTVNAQWLYSPKAFTIFEPETVLLEQVNAIPRDSILGDFYDIELIMKIRRTRDLTVLPDSSPENLGNAADYSPTGWNTFLKGAETNSVFMGRRIPNTDPAQYEPFRPYKRRKWNSPSIKWVPTLGEKSTQED